MLGLSVGVLAAGGALFFVQENPELLDDIRPIAQLSTGVVTVLSAGLLAALGGTLLALDVFWLQPESTQKGIESPHDADLKR